MRLPCTSTQSTQIMHTITSQWVCQGHLHKRMGRTAWAMNMDAFRSLYSTDLSSVPSLQCLVLIKLSRAAVLYAVDRGAGSRDLSYSSGHKRPPMGYRQQPLIMKSGVSWCCALRADFLYSVGKMETRKRYGFDILALLWLYLQALYLLLTCTLTAAFEQNPNHMFC